MSERTSGMGEPVFGPRSVRGNGFAERMRLAAEGTSKPDEGERWVKTKLSEASIEPPKMLVDGIIPTGMVGAIHGAGGEGKTLVAVYLALQAMWRGFSVAILDKENGAHIMRERFEMMGADLPALEQAGLVAFYDHPTAGRDPETVAEYVAMLKADKPDLVIMDSWVGFLGSCGFEENSATDIAAWSDLYTTPARRRGIAVLLLDHTPKDSTNRTARGSSRKRDYVDYQYELEKVGVIDRQSIGAITLKKKKDRGAWLKNVHQFRVGGTAGGFVFEPIDAPYDPVGNTPAGGERATLNALADGMTYAEWKSASGKADTTFERHRDALMAAGLVTHDKAARTYSHPSPPQPPNNPHGGDGGSNAESRSWNPHYPHHLIGGGNGGTDGSSGSDAFPGEDFASTLHRQDPSNGTEDKDGGEIGTSPDNLPSPAVGSVLGVALDGNDVVELGVPDEAGRQIRDLMRRGFSESSARAEVLAKDHPLDCDCEVCA